MTNTLTDSPISSHTLAFDQPLMEANNLYYGNVLHTDHQIGPANGTRNDGITQEGNHTIIHFVNQSGDPSPISSVGQLYTKTLSGDVALYYESGGGVVQLLTANFSPVNANPGISYLAGGLIIKWGSGSAADGAPITFNSSKAFTNLFSLVVSHSAAGAGENPGEIVSAANKSTTGFNIRITPSATISYSYIAIGN
jgi:hypothetical protein